MIAAVHDHDLVATGHGAREAQGETVRVAGGGRDLPVRQAEALDEKLADGQRVLGRQHIGQPTARLGRNGTHDGRRRMPEHRAGIAEAEIRKPVAVDIGQRRAGCLGNDHRKRHGPVEHPLQREAGVVAMVPGGREALGLGAGGGEAGGFALPDGLNAAGLDTTDQ